MEEKSKQDYSNQIGPLVSLQAEPPFAHQTEQVVALQMEQLFKVVSYRLTIP